MDALVIKKLDSYVHYICHVDWIYEVLCWGCNFMYQNKALEIATPQPKTKSIVIVHPLLLISE